MYWFSDIDMKLYYFALELKYCWRCKKLLRIGMVDMLHTICIIFLYYVSRTPEKLIGSFAKWASCEERLNANDNAVLW